MALPREVRAAIGAAIILCGAIPEASGQVQRSDAEAATVCTAAAQAKGLTVPPVRDCLGLAARAVDVLTSSRYLPTPRDVQSDVTGAATAGSLAQSEPVPGAQPLGVAGGSVAAVGSDSGAKAIVALTVNPAIFFSSLNQTDKIAEASRVADLTLLFPVDDLDADEDGRVDYVGARLRLNFNGKKAGKEMLAKLGQRLQSLVGGEADLLLKLDPLFRSAVDVGGCYDAVIGTDD